MKYFEHLTPAQRKSVFYLEPSVFNRDTNIELLSFALGATLYMPATRKNIAEDIILKKHKALTSLVICLEDAIGDKEIQKAENGLLSTLNQLYSSLESGQLDSNNIPLIFIRVRSAEQMARIVKMAGAALSVLTGFVFPKFSLENGISYFNELLKVNASLNRTLYAMPILETEDVIFEETRAETLSKMRTMLEEYKDLILNIRIGATDFSSLFGIRRNYDITIYDIQVIQNCISSIINYFTRRGTEYVVSGPVWEYFSTGERVLKPQIRVSPFTATYGTQGTQVRSKMLDKYLDGLIHETLLDKANGLIGKTIIHPSHIVPVQSLYVVSHEEYFDASNLIQNNNGELGVFKSHYANKMNEVKPHLNWAKKIMNRSKIYGVFNEHQSFTDLLPTEEYL
jgi:citrate lyase beta subunit